jgi:hypothetical protein
MSFASWVFALCALLFAGVTLHVLVTGRASASGRRVQRGTEPAAFWLAVSFLLLSTVIQLAAWRWSETSEEPIRFTAAFFVAPFCLYLAIEALRAGEIVWGNNRFPRRGRAQVYWTILFLYLLGFAFLTAALVYQYVRRS